MVCEDKAMIRVTTNSKQCMKPRQPASKWCELHLTLTK